MRPTTDAFTAARSSTLPRRSDAPRPERLAGSCRRPAGCASQPWRAAVFVMALATLGPWPWPAAAQPLEVRAVANPDVVAPGGQAELAVYVQTPDGAPASRAQVTLAAGGGQFAETGTTSVSGQTDAAGFFRAHWRAVPASAYVGRARYVLEAHVERAGAEPVRRQIHLGVDPAAPASAAPAPVVPGVVRAEGWSLAELPLTVEATVTPGTVGPGGVAEFSLRVLDAHGAPVPGAQVDLMAGGGTFRVTGTRAASGRTDSAGHYRVEWEAHAAAAYRAELRYGVGLDVAKPGFRAVHRELNVTVSPGLPAQPPSHAGSLPACTPAQNAAWERARRETMGVTARDPDTHDAVGGAPADRSMAVVSWWNWWPMSFSKATLCGTLHRFSIHAFSFIGNHEVDWNLFVVPDPPFRYLIDAVSPFHPPDGKDEWHACIASRDCMEVEVTPAPAFIDNRWFPGRHVGPPGFGLAEADPTRPVSRLGQRLCSYGTWVLERVHGYRPEVHPAELYWWNEGGPLGPYHLMQVMDASNRFSRPRHFWLSEYPAPPGWTPWAGTPRRGEFRVAFEVRPGSETLTYTLRQEARGRLHPTQRDESAFDNALVLDGRTAVSVRELQPVDDEVAVRFEELCRAGPSVRGYVGLTSELGDGGYHVLRLTGASSAYAQAAIEQQAAGVAVADPVALEALAANAAVTRTLVAGAQAARAARLVGLRHALVHGRPSLVGDLELAAPPTRAHVSGAHASELRLRSSDATPGGVVAEALPLLGGGVLELTTQSGQAERVALPAVAVVPTEVGTRALARRDVPEAWGAYTRAARLAPEELRPFATLTAVGQREIDVAGEYAPVRGAEPASEDGSPVSRALNRALGEDDVGGRRTLFGDGSPQRVHWSFEAREVTRGEAVPVATGSGDGPIVAEAASRPLPGGGSIEGGRLRVRFAPAADAVYRVTATARLQDSFGLVGQRRFVVWSHQVAAASPAALAAALEGALREPAPAGIERSDHPLRVDELLRAESRIAAADGQVDPDELSRLVRAARRLRR